MFMEGFIERLLIWTHRCQRRPALPNLLKNKGCSGMFRVASVPGAAEGWQGLHVGEHASG